MTLLAILAALVLCVPGALAHADEVDLGISLAPNEAAPAAGATGALDLGIALGTTGVAVDADPSDGSLDLGIMLGASQYREVRFAGYYCGADGSIDEARGMETLGEVQRVVPGGRAQAPDGTTRTYEEGGSVQEYWLDGWYVLDPRIHPDAKPVSLTDIEIAADTVLYCLWKKGYVIKLDANNGDDEAAAELFGGAVAAPGHVIVPRDPAYDEDGGEAPAGVAYADFPKATRPGYAFKGWYWPETKWQAGQEVPKTDEHGRAVLSEAAGPVVPADGSEGEMPYDELRAHSGDTLYAKWEVAPSVRITLDDARDAELNYGISLWFWPGRGYTLAAPSADMELTANAVATSAGEVPLQVAHNPVPEHAAQYFSGWGYGNAIKTDAGYADDQLLSCEKVEDDSGKGGWYRYSLTERAFAGDYVGEGMAWVDTRYTAPDPDTGGLKTTWDALATSAHIRVRAPFEVTFEKAGDGYDPDSNPGDVAPYAPDELEWEEGDAVWLQSLGQRFTNLSERSVYVSGIECVNVGASAMLPGGANGSRLFSLYEEAGSPEGTTAIPFGYASVGSANKASVSPYDPDRWLVLPVAEGDGFSKALYFGLNLRDAAFDRTAIAMGSAAGDSYVAKVANVKYTYSVVP